MQLSTTTRTRTRTRAASIAFVAALAALAACNGSTTAVDFGGASGAGGIGFAGPSPAPPSGAAFPAPGSICPTSVPIEGKSCTPGDGTCEYGGSEDPACNTVARCNTTTLAWTVDQATHCTGTCPEHFDERVPGATCSGDQVCTYLEATCGCAGAIDGAWTSITGGSNTVADGGTDASAADGGDAAASPPAIGTWQCVRPGNGCPARRPLEGTRCTTAIDCDYGTCVFGVPLSMTCVNGRWTALFVGSCP